jgi:hypothetical protein
MSELPPIIPGTESRSPNLSGPLVFHGRARDVLSKKGLLAVLCGISLVGIPYALVLYYRWFARKTSTVNGNKFVFLGGIGTLYGLFLCTVLIAVCFRMPLLLKWFGPFHSPGAIYAVMLPLLLLQSIANGVVGFFYMRYFFANLEDLQHRRIDFAVPLVRYIAFYLLIALSFFTIIGWAWIMCWLYRWLFRNLRIEGAKINFTGTGFGLLWRSIVFAICFFPIVTIPWATVWFYRWLVSRVEIRHESGAAYAFPAA